MIYYKHGTAQSRKTIFGGFSMNTTFYEMIKRKDWVKVAEAWEDLKAAGTAHGVIFWAGGNYFVMIEDVPSNPRTFIADSFSGLFVDDNYAFFRKEEFKKCLTK